MLTMTELTTLPLGSEIPSEGGPTLKIAIRSWNPGADEAAVIARTLPADTIVATQDGKGALLDAWHTGPSAADVYVERFSRIGGAEARTFHGFVDSETRQLVQAG